MANFTTDGNGIQTLTATPSGDAGIAINGNFSTISSLITTLNSAIAAANTAIATANSIIAGKAARAPTPTAGHFATVDSSGNVIDSGHANVTGAVVGTTDTQTLTNKTIDCNSNTITNLPGGSPGGSVGQFQFNGGSGFSGLAGISTDGSTYATLANDFALSVNMVTTPQTLIPVILVKSDNSIGNLNSLNIGIVSGSNDVSGGNFSYLNVFCGTQNAPIIHADGRGSGSSGVLTIGGSGWAINLAGTWPDLTSYCTSLNFNQITGTAPNPFDQTLNTSSSVQFSAINLFPNGDLQTILTALALRISTLEGYFAGGVTGGPGTNVTATNGIVTGLS